MKYHFVTILLIITISYGYPQSDDQGAVSEKSNQSPGDDKDMYLEPQNEGSLTEDRETSQQTFYPAFSPFQNPPLGHSRPFLFQQEGAYSQRPHGGYHHQQVAYDSPRYSGYKDVGYRSAANSESRGLLGSGNFGVIRGGTFYDNKDNDAAHYDRERDYSPYFRNGHGRPSFHYGGVPNPRPYQHEQFENFRDFADINTPSNSAYSQYVVVYVNKNATRHHQDEVKSQRPKNIIESLALLDLENTSSTEIPQKKLSKSKAKLAKLLPEKKHKFKKNSIKASREPREPLLALS